MSKKVMKYILLFLVFTLPLLLPFTPITNSKYVAKKSKKIIINLEQPKYKIRFKANGGVGEDVLQEFTYKEAQALIHNPFTYASHGFLEWNTEQDGSGQSYDDEETVINLSSLNGDEIVLYAQWIDAVARIGTTYYNSLGAAFTAANRDNSGDLILIELLQNVSENGLTLNANHNAVLNLRGNTINNTANVNVLVNKGTLTVKNGTIRSSAATNGIINNDTNKSTLTLDDVHLEVYGEGNRQALYNKNGIATIKGGSVLTTVSTQRPAVTNTNNGTLTILDADIIAYNYVGLVNDNSTLTIGDNSDEVSITNPSIRGSSSGLTTNNNKVYFYDGILKGKTNAVDHPANLLLPDDHILLDKEETIDGNLYKEKYIGVGVKITLNPNGGNLANDLRVKYVAIGSEVGILPEPTKAGNTFVGWFTEQTGGEIVTPDYVLSEDTTLFAHWSIDTNGAAVILGADNGLDYDVEYDTLQHAIDDVSGSGTTKIRLLKNTSECVTVPAGKNIDFDFGSYKLTPSKNDAVITNEGNLTISSGTFQSSVDTGAINQNAGTLNITGGTFNATGTRQVIYAIGGTTNISGDAYLSSTATGKPTDSQLQRGTVQMLPNTVLNVYGGTIVSTTQNAISNEGVLTLGMDDGTISTTIPSIIGNTDGVCTTGTFNFYDGHIQSGVKAIDGMVTQIPQNAHVAGTTTDAYLEVDPNLNMMHSALPKPAVNKDEDLEETDKDLPKSENEENTDKENIETSTDGSDDNKPEVPKQDEAIIEPTEGIKDEDDNDSEDTPSNVPIDNTPVLPASVTEPVIEDAPKDDTEE